MNPAKYAVDAQRITKRFYNRHAENKAKTVFSEYSFVLEKGRTLAILGPSGCGKSSLLRIIAGLERADHGKVEVFGELPLHQTRGGQISFFSSDNTLLPWRSASKNVELPLDLLRKDQPVAQKLSSELLEEVRIEPMDWSRRPHQLSEGQRQRLRLAQALVTQPRLLLLDEPFSNVDEGLRRVLMDIVLTHLKKSSERSAVLVTHHAFEAATMADEVIILSGEPAKEIYRKRLKGAPSTRERSYIDDLVANLSARMVALMGDLRAG